MYALSEGPELAAGRSRRLRRHAAAGTSVDDLSARRRPLFEFSGQERARWVRLRGVTSSDLWDAETAEQYDESSAFMFAPEVLDPAVDLLAELAGDGPALELAIGTGSLLQHLMHVVAC